MPPVPVHEADVIAEIRARGLLLAGATRGKVVIEFDWRDGCWSLGNIGLVFPRGRHLTQQKNTLDTPVRSRVG
jgi:hypothetical protein